MSHIPTVEKWIVDLRRRMESVPENTQYYQQMKKWLKEYEDLLADLRSRHTKPRESGEEG